MKVERIIAADERNGVVFMAFAAGRESQDNVVFPKYIGVGMFNVISVNPTKAEAEVIYGRDIENEIVYTSKDEKTDVAQVRLDFIVKTIPEKNDGIELLSKISFFLKNEPRLNRDGDKIEVINKYGETTWVTIEQAQAGLNEVPANVSGWFEGPYRPVCVGESDLTSFLKIYMSIPGKSYKKKSGEIVYLENPADAEARLDNIMTYFSGNVREIQQLVKLQPNNKVQLAIGVKTTDDNKQYQDCFTKMPMRSNLKDFSKLDAAIKDAKDNGAYSHTEFSIKPLAEYSVEATSFTNTPVAPKAAPVFANFFGAAPAVVAPPVVEAPKGLGEDVPF